MTLSDDALARIKELVAEAPPVSQETLELIATVLRQSADERRLRSQLGAHVSWANTEDRTARTAPARAGMDAKFLREADGDPVRAKHLRKAFYLNLSLKSARARRKKKEKP